MIETNNLIHEPFYKKFNDQELYNFYQASYKSIYESTQYDFSNYDEILKATQFTNDDTNQNYRTRLTFRYDRELDELSRHRGITMTRNTKLKQSH